MMWRVIGIFRGHGIDCKEAMVKLYDMVSRVDISWLENDRWIR
jgi:hypothetical protein